MAYFDGLFPGVNGLFMFVNGIDCYLVRANFVRVA